MSVGDVQSSYPSANTTYQYHRGIVELEAKSLRKAADANDVQTVQAVGADAQRHVDGAAFAPDIAARLKRDLANPSDKENLYADQLYLAALNAPRSVLGPATGFQPDAQAQPQGQAPPPQQGEPPPPNVPLPGQIGVNGPQGLGGMQAAPAAPAGAGPQQAAFGPGAGGLGAPGGFGALNQSQNGLYSQPGH